MEYIYTLLGLLLLFVGGEVLVRGAVVLSKRLGLSALLIGSVVVGFGTSTPEMIVSVQAALHDQPGIALGNVVGSNIANVMLILAIAALITPLPCQDPAIRRDSMMVVVASLLMMMAAQMGLIAGVAGAGMIVLLGVYLSYCYQAERKSTHEKRVEKELEISKMKLPVAIIAAVGGIAVLMIGAQYLIDGATAIARSFGLSEAIIGLTLIAVGTSLPELAASAIGAWRRHTDMVVGNILGSNLFNILAVLGVTSVIKPVPVEGRIADLDIPIMLGVAIATLAVIAMRGRIGRKTGALALVLYGVYVAGMFSAG